LGKKIQNMFFQNKEVWEKDENQYNETFHLQVNEKFIYYFTRFL